MPVSFYSLRRLPSLAAVIVLVLSTPVAATSKIEWQDHEYALRSGETIHAQLGAMAVPNHRDAARNGGSTTIRFVRLPATNGATGLPIIYLAGGPGSSGIDAARGDRWKLFNALRQHGDVILLDQRGVGLSSPPPDCSTPWHFSNDVATTETNMAASLEAAVAVCAAEWRARGVDLSIYNISENAADVADLARALGGRARLVGISYGTFLAFAVLRDHGDLIDRVVLAGTEGPDHTLKLPLQADRVFDALSTRAKALKPSEPRSLRDGLTSVLARLAKSPVTVETKDRSGTSTSLVISKYDVQVVVSFLMATSENRKRIPSLIEDMDRGEFGGMARNVAALRRFLAPLPAMPLAMDAASPVSQARQQASKSQAARSVFGNAVNWPDANFAAAMGVKPLDRRWSASLKSNVPAFFISGDLDSRTPPANAIAVRKGFKTSVHLILDGAGHDNDLFLSSPIIIDQIQEFLKGKKLVDQRIVAIP